MNTSQQFPEAGRLLHTRVYNVCVCVCVCILTYSFTRVFVQSFLLFRSGWRCAPDAATLPSCSGDGVFIPVRYISSFAPKVLAAAIWYFPRLFPVPPLNAAGHAGDGRRREVGCSCFNSVHLDLQCTSAERPRQRQKDKHGLGKLHFLVIYWPCGKPVFAFIWVPFRQLQSGQE